MAPRELAETSRVLVADFQKVYHMLQQDTVFLI
jgi:hypothetical protein